jgi:hypothetical protein
MARGRCLGRFEHTWQAHPSRDETRWRWCGTCGAEALRYPGDGLDEVIAVRDAKRARVAKVSSAAAGVLQEWLPGYYSEFGKIVALEPEGTYRVDPLDPDSGNPLAGKGKVYRIKVQVEEVANP